MTTHRIDKDSLAEFSAGLFEAVGVPVRDAEHAAQTLVEADLRGIYSHGTVRLQPGYLEALTAGTTNPTPNITAIRESPSHALLDGDAGLGQIVSRVAMEKAIEMARSSAIGVVAVQKSTHFGAAAYWPMMAAEQGFIGFACSDGPGINTAPYGGAEPAQGNLPLSWAVPAGEEFPILLDMATGVAAFGKIAMARLRNEPIPLGWAIDAKGRDTTDAHKAVTVLPAGGPKGYGLGVILDSLTGTLSGGLPSIVKLKDGSPDGLQDASSHFFLAINVEMFIPIDEFRETVDRHIQLIREIRPRDGFDRVYLPGEIEWRTKEKRLAEGIPFRPEEIEVLAQMGRDNGVQPAWSGE